MLGGGGFGGFCGDEGLEGEGDFAAEVELGFALEEDGFGGGGVEADEGGDGGGPVAVLRVGVGRGGGRGGEDVGEGGDVGGVGPVGEGFHVDVVFDGVLGLDEGEEEGLDFGVLGGVEGGGGEEAGGAGLGFVVSGDEGGFGFGEGGDGEG